MSRMPYLIGIAGPSGAGKSYLAEHLARALSPAAIIPLDAYYPDLSALSIAERSRLNFDDPALLDAPLLTAQLTALAHGQSVRVPVYDFAQHTRSRETRLVAPVRFVIVEGLFTLYWPELRSLLQTKVYVDMSDPICLERRLARDVQERGRTAASVEHQFQLSVRPMAALHVRPTAGFADVLVRGDMPIANEVAAVMAHISSRPL